LKNFTILWILHWLTCCLLLYQCCWKKENYVARELVRLEESCIVGFFLHFFACVLRAYGEKRFEMTKGKRWNADNYYIQNTQSFIAAHETQQKENIIKYLNREIKQLTHKNNWLMIQIRAVSRANLTNVGMFSQFSLFWPIIETSSSL
jgi:hypothetical protein